MLTHVLRLYTRQTNSTTTPQHLSRMAKGKINWWFVVAHNLGLARANRAGIIATHQGNPGIQRHGQHKLFIINHVKYFSSITVNKANLTSVSSNEDGELLFLGTAQHLSAPSPQKRGKPKGGGPPCKKAQYGLWTRRQQVASDISL